MAEHSDLILLSAYYLVWNGIDVLSQFVGVTAVDFKKPDSDGLQIIEALQFNFQCSIIVHSDHDTR